MCGSAATGQGFPLDGDRAPEFQQRGSRRMSVHPTAVIAEGVAIPESCTVGPFCTIGPEVLLGEGCNLVSHVVLDGRTRIGERNTIYPFTSIGIPPQDLKYGGEPTETLIG